MNSYISILYIELEGSSQTLNFLVCVFFCRECDLQYIGQTGKSVNADRISQHTHAMRLGLANNGILNPLTDKNQANDLNSSKFIYNSENSILFYR